MGRMRSLIVVDQITGSVKSLFFLALGWILGQSVVLHGRRGDGRHGDDSRRSQNPSDRKRLILVTPSGT
jgi:hypothetical protein